MYNFANIVLEVHEVKGHIIFLFLDVNNFIIHQAPASTSS